MTTAKQEKPITERVNDMAKWAAQKDAQLKELTESLASVRQMRLDAATNSAPKSGDTAEELKLVWQRYTSPATDLRELRATLIQNEMILAQVNSEIDLAEGNAMLDASTEIDDKGKPLYTNEATRKAAAARILANDDAYRQLAEAKRLSAAAIANAKSEIQYNEDLAKEFMSRSRAMIARLENETAQLNAIKK